MNEELQSVMEQMEPLLAKLKACPPETFPTRKKLPDRGVYVFYEGKEPLYVGRSNQIWKRVQTHGRRGATHNQATFAFRLLAKKYNLEMGHGTGADRSQKAREYAAEFQSNILPRVLTCIARASACFIPSLRRLAAKRRTDIRSTVYLGPVMGAFDVATSPRLR